MSKVSSIIGSKKKKLLRKMGYKNQKDFEERNRYFVKMLGGKVSTKVIERLYKSGHVAGEKELDFTSELNDLMEELQDVIEEINQEKQK
jgi:hypothetical protein